MSARDRLTSVNIAPGSALESGLFNISTVGSMEWNIDDENQRRTEHLNVGFIVTIPTFYDDEFDASYTPANALEATRNTSDNATIDIHPGVAYIGGRRYKQINPITGHSISGGSSASHYIRLKYTLSTNTFTFITELASSPSDDTNDEKYLTLASATWNGTSWDDDFVDLRATNTSLPIPVSFIGTVSDPILTIQQEGTGLSLRVKAGSSGGGAQFFDTTNPETVDIYGTSTTGLTIHDNTTLSVTLSCDNSNRLLISNDVKATSGYLGSVIISGTTVQDFNTLTFDSSATIGATSATGIAFSSLNFTGVGSIGCSSVDATGNIQGSQLISDIVAGTAPLSVTSGTKVTTLNVDQVDGYDFTGTAGSVTSSATELNKLDGFTGDVDDLNKIKESGRAQGDVLYASAADTLGWLTASNGILRMTSGTPAWTLTPTLTGVTVAGGTGITFDNTTTDVVLTSTDGVLNIGNNTIRDASAGDWSITGVGAGTFVSVAITNGPSLTASGIAFSSGDDITGLDNLSCASITTTGQIDAGSLDLNSGAPSAGTISFDGIHGGATEVELNNAADATGRAKGDLRYASAADTLGWLAAGSDGQYLKQVSGAPAWATLPTFDNYVSWTFAVDGAAKDPITSGDTLDFVGGTGISISRSGDDQITITNTETDTWRGIDNTPVDGQTGESITSNWAYDHAVGQTVNLHTKVGTISSGTWQGSAISSSYLDSTPLFSTLTLNGTAGAPTTHGQVRLGEDDNGLEIQESTLGSIGSAALTIGTRNAALPTRLGWVFFVSSASHSLHTDTDFLPYADNTYACGSSALRWSEVNAFNVNSGDINFDNEMYITEAKDDDGILIEERNGVQPALMFMNRDGEELMRLDANGVLHVKEIISDL